MKSDLDALMEGRNLDALLVLGSAENNPPMYYMTGGGHVRNAVLIKKRGEQPVLYCNAMEREEAAKSGFNIIPLKSAPIEEFIIAADSFLKEQELLTGKIGLYGEHDVGETVSFLQKLQRDAPGVTVVGEARNDSVFLRAMETKEEGEVTRIRKMGEITTQVVGMVAEYLTNCDVRNDEVLLKNDGEPLTIGDVKGKISLWLAERGAVDSEGFIFSIGRDAGLPHSGGTHTDLIRLGKTIVFDIYPAEVGGGYFFDFTRTWSLGYATPEAQRLYHEVKRVYQKVVENIDLNVSFKEYQKLTCDEFHNLGHKTPMHDEGVLTEGYVHSLGHGLGLNVHERPLSRHTLPDDNILKPGVVITIEPGLYYPEKQMGVRIEDTYWMRPDGTIQILAEYPYDFVLEMKKWKKG
jgi:Xaa-Pro aminopeptidase